MQYMSSCFTTKQQCVHNILTAEYIIITMHFLHPKVYRRMVDHPSSLTGWNLVAEISRSRIGPAVLYIPWYQASRAL